TGRGVRDRSRLVHLCHGRRGRAGQRGPAPDANSTDPLTAAGERLGPVVPPGAAADSGQKPNSQPQLTFVGGRGLGPRADTAACGEGGQSPTSRRVWRPARAARWPPSRPVFATVS